LIIAYASCIAHGIEMTRGLSQQKLAVQSGHWPLLRFDPRRTAEGKNPMQLDSKAPSVPLEDYLYNETRYTTLRQTHPEAAKRLLEQAQQDVAARWKMYETWAGMGVTSKG
jgi:pyruvate-ferredoxin/flavodoxin oxidoreductase